MHYHFPSSLQNPSNDIRRESRSLFCGPGSLPQMSWACGPVPSCLPLCLQLLLLECFLRSPVQNDEREGYFPSLCRPQYPTSSERQPWLSLSGRNPSCPQGLSSYPLSSPQHRRHQICTIYCTLEHQQDGDSEVDWLKSVPHGLSCWDPWPPLGGAVGEGYRTIWIQVLAGRSP